MRSTIQGNEPTSGSCTVGCLVVVAALALAIAFFAWRGCGSPGAPKGQGDAQASPVKREWSAKEQVRNPVEYLKNQLAVLDKHYADNAASLHQLLVTRSELERERANEEAELRQLDKFLEDAKRTYREAEAANSWPASIGGFTLTREKAREKIVEAAHRRDEIRGHDTLKGNRKAAIENRVKELEAEQANIANLRKKIPQVIRDIETQKIIDDNGGVSKAVESIRISMEVLSPRFDNPTLGQLLPSDDSSASDSEFDAIMAEP
jgi:prefoldin subunit 5